MGPNADDCIALSALSEDEIAAIAEHEHIPMIEAAALADYLIRQPDGRNRVRYIIVEDIAAARRRGELRHVAELDIVLRRFVETYGPKEP